MFWLTMLHDRPAGIVDDFVMRKTIKDYESESFIIYAPDFVEIFKDHCTVENSPCVRFDSLGE